MVKHEFGIMMNMNCGNTTAFLLMIKIWKMLLKGLPLLLLNWHTLLAKNKGLAYYGVTLVPPCPLKTFIDVIADIPELCE